jgi:non-ribosomal peptide synthetase component F
MREGTRHALLRDRAPITPDLPAILAPGRTGMTYGELLARAVGIERRVGGIATDPAAWIAVALLPNGPEMAVAYLGAMAYRPCVQQDPAEPGAELRKNPEPTAACGVVAAAYGSAALRNTALASGRWDRWRSVGMSRSRHRRRLGPPRHRTPKRPR